jgi:pimeloyl-ACP methyl ester carboxylesterase
VALTFARRYPERVRGLLLFSTFARHPRAGGHWLAPDLGWWQTLTTTLPLPTIYAMRLAALPSQIGPAWSWSLARSYLGLPRPYPPAFRHKYDLALTFDARPWLSEIRCPAFVSVGTWDPIVPASAGRELARLLPDATLYEQHGGHLVQFARARELGSRISRWIDELALRDRAAAR